MSRLFRGFGSQPQPSPMTMKRVQREISDLKKEDLSTFGMRLDPVSEASLLEWTGAIPGPEGSVYEGGVFEFSLTLPIDYPFTAPRISFKTRIYHMNVSDSGHICLDILKTMWSPALSLFKVMLSLSSLLTDPNPNDPLVPAIAGEFKSNRPRHDATAKQWTAMYAKPKSLPVKAPNSATSNGAVPSPSPLPPRTSAPTTQTTITTHTTRLLSHPHGVTSSSHNHSATASSSSTLATTNGNGRFQTQSTAASRPEVIEVSDSDDEPTTTSRPSTAGSKRKRTNRDDGPSFSGGSGSSASVRAAASSRRISGGSGSGGGGSSRGRGAVETIVIDSD